VKLKLYRVPGSHPSDCVEAALRLKGLEYDRVDLLPVVHKAVMRAAGFGGVTVPGLVIDGQRMLGSRAILRRLDELVPEPPLLPADPQLRARVLEAEAWGDDVLQPLARRVSWGALRRNTPAMFSYVGNSRLGVPQRLLSPAAKPTAWAASRLNRAGDETVRSDLVALPAHLDRIDAWIADGLLGGEEPNAADLQIGSSLRLLMTLGDVRPLIEARPCASLARRWFADRPGDVPAGALPAAWVPAPASAATTAP
jgi:glutathione S-transferase